MSDACPQLCGYPPRKLAVFRGDSCVTGPVRIPALGIGGFAGSARSIQFTLQSVVKTSFPRRLGYHSSIKRFLQFFAFIGVSRGCSEMGPDVLVGHTA